MMVFINLQFHEAMFRYCKQQMTFVSTVEKPHQNPPILYTKVNVPNPVSDLYQRPVFEWSVVKYDFGNEEQKDMCWKEMFKTCSPF